MPNQTAGTATPRGTILVASSNALFIDIVGDLVAACGFTPAYWSADEESRLSLTSIQPCIAICDCAAPDDGIKRLIVEASARHTPLVLSDPRMDQSTNCDAPSPAPLVEWLTFPVSQDVFRAMLESLVPSEIVARSTS